MGHTYPEVIEDEWIAFPGGELEGRRPKALCPACRAAVARAAASRRSPGREAQPGVARRLCFQCYRAELDRERTLKAAGQLDTASDARFQFVLPFAPVDQPRLARLRAERAIARAAVSQGSGRFADRRRQAQIAARHALQSIASELAARRAAATERERVIAEAIRAAELQLPESWLPYVVSR